MGRKVALTVAPCGRRGSHRGPACWTPAAGRGGTSTPWPGPATGWWGSTCAGQVAAAAGDGAGGDGRLLAASVLALPFQNGAFDAPSPSTSCTTPATAPTRIARPGRDGPRGAPRGLVLVHEISTVNPLYRLYMAYLFPSGSASTWAPRCGSTPASPPAGGATLTALHHYTFLPDFTPRGLYHYLVPLEGWLEASRWAPYAPTSPPSTSAGRRHPPLSPGAVPPLRAPQGALT